MLETAVALVLAHLLADFVLQTDRILAGKRRPSGMAAHVAIVGAASWLALGLPLRPLPILLVVLAHAAIDAAKLRWGRPGFAAFAADQAAHLASIWVVAELWPATYAAGLWSAPPLPAAMPGLARLPEAMALAAGLIGTVWAGGYAVRELMAGLKLPVDPEQDTSLPLGGQLIGRLERLMILMLILARQPEGIGLLIAAKSILRFNELAREADRRASEYVIIGTLASFAWAIATSWATAAALDALTSP
jgi:hypothetical protein